MSSFQGDRPAARTAEPGIAAWQYASRDASPGMFE